MNKSKELAKLLGIKPKYINKNFNKIQFDSLKSMLAFFFKQAPALVDRGIEFNKEDVSEAYPDFEKPENFVKLLELTRQTGLMFEGFYDCTRFKTIQELIIVQVIAFLQESQYGLFQEKFKSEAQKTDWIY